MRIKYLQLQCVLITVFLALTTTTALGQKMFSPGALKEDLQFYRTQLEQNQPNLYLYTSKEVMDNFFDSLYASIDKPLDETAFYGIITLTSQKVKDGHTLILPGRTYTAFHNANSRFMPFQIGIFENQLYIKMNCTASKLIEDGTVIDSINGTAAKDILYNLCNRQVRDGNNLSYCLWILNNYFREYYSFIFGHPDSFYIAFTQGQRRYHIRAAALPKDSIYYYRQKNYPAFHFDKKPFEGLTLQFDNTKETAILSIKDFHNDVLRKDYHQNFKTVINNFFDSIFLHKTEHLIIDLRNNQGGDIENGVHLLSYLVNKPFKVINSYACIENNAVADCNGASLGFHKPEKKVFEGDMYVLINGGSFSNSAIVSSCLKEYTKAIFAGTESGGNPNVLSGNARDFELPNTKIMVEIPSKRFVMTSMEKNTGEGLKPDYFILNDIHDNMLQKDIPLATVLELIEKKSK